MKLLWQATLPVKTVSPNKQEHWTAKKNRNDLLCWWLTYYWCKDSPQVQLPCTVKVSRIASRLLDEHDNLRMALKPAIDAIADKIIPGLAPGRADGDKRITWEYGQRKPEKGRQPSVEIVIYQQ